tara:strand:- start:1291 stop:2349 length:1059 start_codon:yes stop_codon:yes gene_type:complete
MKNKRQYYAHTVLGLESVLGGEIIKIGGELEESLPGLIQFSWSGNLFDLFNLGISEDVFFCLLKTDVSLEKGGLKDLESQIETSKSWGKGLEILGKLSRRREKRIRFRVIAQRHRGGQKYVRTVLRDRVTRVIERRFPSWKAVADGENLEFWVWQSQKKVFCGLRLSDRTMRHRTYKIKSISASLRPVVARAMVILTKPTDDDVFLDPMCGAGTLLIERGESGRYRELLGGDISDEAIYATKKNIGPRYKPIKIRQWNACNLPLDSGSVNRVACNLPFGKKIKNSEDLPDLYARVLGEIRRVVRPYCPTVLLTSERNLLVKLLEKNNGFKVEQTLPIELLGQRAYTVVIRAI